MRLLFDPTVRYVVVTAVIWTIVFVRIGQIISASSTDTFAYDFAAYWLAGLNILEGHPLYTDAQLSGPYEPEQQYHGLYLYPPFFAVLMTPFAAVFDDYRSAAWAWAAGGAVVVIATVVAVARLEGLRRTPQLILLVGAVFALPPVPLEMFMGNVHLLMLGLLSLAWIGFRRGGVVGDLLAGVPLAIATLIKLFPGVLIIWLLLVRRPRAAVAAVAAILTLVFLTLPITGLGSWIMFSQALVNLGPPPSSANVLAPTVWLTEVTELWAARVIVGSLGLAALVWAARARPASMSFGAAIMVSLLIVPAMYLHYLAAAVLPLILAFAHARPSTRAVIVYAVLFVGTQLALWDPTSTIGRVAATGSAVALLALLLFGPSRESPGTVEKSPVRSS